jgi:hypothetical protein
MIDVRALVGSHDILFITLDTLRYDVAQTSWREGRTPTLAGILPPDGWQQRHSPATFTYAAHQSFFAGFFPTPVEPGAAKQERPFALRFPGSSSIGSRTAVFDAPDIVAGVAGRGYHTICVGGVGFFNPATPLGTVLPALFREQHFDRRMGVTEPRSTEHQVALAVRRLRELPRDQRVFLFLNVSAIHHPNRHYLPGAERDSLASHAAALAYVDGQLPPLFRALALRAPTFAVLCSDHGTTYGEDGYHGHRLSHPAVWTVPYAEVLLPSEDAA